MKEILTSQGWKCLPCSCPGAKGFDCAIKDFKGIIIKLKTLSFKIVKNGLVVDTGHNYEFETKLKSNDIFKEII